MEKVFILMAVILIVSVVFLAGRGLGMIIRNEWQVRKFEKEQENNRRGATRLAEDLKKELDEMKGE